MKHSVLLNNLSIGYHQKGETKIIAKGLNASIEAGELTCLLGSNGIGKSTLLRTIAAFQPKIQGEIIVRGRKIESYKEQDFSKIVGVVLTERVDAHNMTVFEMVSLGRSPYTGFWGRMSGADHQAVMRAIEQVRIGNLRHRMIHSLSDGERQKTMIAKALAQETPIIILDEPTAFLDFPSKVDMMQLLHRLSREMQKTIFLSTHDLELALQIADKIWLLDDQHSLHIGTPEDLALTGQLGHFFQQKEIIFDETTGLFRIENDYDRSIKVIGHGYRYAMVRKALLRNRINADRNVNTDTVIDTRGDKLTLQRQSNPPIELASIQQLLEEIL